MSTTDNWSIYYPSGSTAPDVPLAMRTQAETVDAAIDALADSPFIQVARTGTNQALTTGAKTAVSWNYRVGTAGMNSSTNPTMVMCTQSGVYRIDATLLYSAVSGGFRSLSLRVNGVAADIEVSNNTAPSGMYNNAMSGSAYIRLIEGDAVEVMAEVLTPASDVTLVAGGTTDDLKRFSATRATFMWVRP